MNLKKLIIIALATLALASCNFSLADDITPPPGYQSPTPAPTLGALFPASAPMIENGERIFAEKCSPCHGVSGMGDGEQGKQLPNPVPAIGASDIARQAVPADWYTVVSIGRLDRFMPPFHSLSDQERWDVVSYVQTLSVSEFEIEKGKALYLTNCVECHGTDGKLLPESDFTNQEYMAKRSAFDLARAVLKGAGEMKPFNNLNEEDAYALAGYMRTFTFGAPQPTATPLPPTPTADAALEATATPEAGLGAAPTVTSAPNTTGVVRGLVTNGTSGGAIPSDLKITLHGFEHNAQDPSGAPQEVLTQDAPVNADGTFVFENVDLPLSRIYFTTVVYNNVEYSSEFVNVEEGASTVELNSTFFETTSDYNELTFEQVHVFFSPPVNEMIEGYALYIFSNKTDKAIVIENLPSQEIPFVRFPSGATNTTYEDAQMGGAFQPTQSGGFVIMPDEKQYGIAAGFSLPYTKSLDFKMPMDVQILSGSVLVPEGMQAKSELLTERGAEVFQEESYQIYNFTSADADKLLAFTISGKPKGSAVLNLNGNLLLAVGAIGLVLIGAGVWLYLREKRKDTLGEDNEDETEILDAIISLDEQFRTGNLSEEAYKSRRQDLKNKLKEKGHS